MVGFPSHGSLRIVQDGAGDLGQRPAPRGLRGAHRDVSTLRLRRRDGVPWIQRNLDPMRR